MTTNPYLWPAREKQVKLVYRPMRLGLAAEQMKRSVLAIGTTCARRGYAYPSEAVVERHAMTRFGDNRVTITFPPKAPESMEAITVCDQDWNARTLIYTPAAAEELDHPGTVFYFDLNVGGWVVFSAERIPWAIGTPYESVAARYPAPIQEDQ